jgi:hypothetical protein
MISKSMIFLSLSMLTMALFFDLIVLYCRMDRLVFLFINDHYVGVSEPWAYQMQVDRGLRASLVFVLLLLTCRVVLRMSRAARPDRVLLLSYCHSSLPILQSGDEVLVLVRAVEDIAIFLGENSIFMCWSGPLRQGFRRGAFGAWAFVGRSVQ